MDYPTLWLVAGPNGVGKTTYARRHIARVSGSRAFVNIDEIARGLSPLDPEAQRVRAARVSLDYLRDALTARNGSRASLTLETTLAGHTHLRTIDLAREHGWGVNLLYFIVAAPEIALHRIKRRVAEGGHDIPEADARRRFFRSQVYFPRYASRCDFWRVFDNNAADPVTIAEGRGACRSYLAADVSGMPQPLGQVLQEIPDC